MIARMTPEATSEDAELVNASLAGNREAFGQIVSRYQSLVCSLAYSATGSLSHSEDLAQETFLTAWKHLAELREPAKLRAWLCGIARNLINSSLRTQVREPSHRAESLDVITESHSPEPSPVERAISQEEADILWRSLERIPENYRVPLVLFYREHQSVEAVAQNLELEEDAVRQRLSRGRKLLQEEILAFVEGALEKTSPGRTFTLAVVAALPIGVTSATAATASVAVAKGVTGAKSTFALGALVGLMAMLGGIAFSWKTAVEDSKSLRERRFMVRMGCFQLAFFVVSMGAAMYLLPKLSERPWTFGLFLALLIAANVVNGVVVLTYMVRRRLEIGMEEGTWTESLAGGPDNVNRPKAVRRAFKLTIPFLIMLAGMVVALPWKQHWIRSAIVTGADVLIILWFFRRTLRQLCFQNQPRLKSKLPEFMQNPFIKLSFMLFITMLVAGVGGILLPFFLNPEAMKSGIPVATWLRPFGLYFLVAVLVYVIVALIFFRRRQILPNWKWLAGKLDMPFLNQLQAMTQGPDAVFKKTYAPLFQQLNLGQDQRVQLKDLVLKRTMVGVRVGMTLMNSKLDAAKRTELAQETKRETDGWNTKIKEYLGAENYAQFQQFEKTVPDRTMLNMFAKRCDKTATALSPEQQAQLLQALTQAREEYPWTTELSRRNQNAGDYEGLFTEANMSTFALEEEQFDRQFLAQAQLILNPEQLAAFEKHQQRQRQSQVAQFKMAAKLFVPK